MSFLKVLGYKQLIYMNYIFPSALRNNIHLFSYYVMLALSLREPQKLTLSLVTLNTVTFKKKPHSLWPPGTLPT